MEKLRIEKIRTQINTNPKLSAVKAALAVADRGHTGQMMKGPKGVELPSYVDGHLLEMYAMACDLGFSPADSDDDENDVKLLCALILHDVVEDSDKLKEHNRTLHKKDRVEPIDSAEKLIEAFKNELKKNGITEPEQFAHQIANIVMEDTNLDTLPGGKRVTHIHRAKHTMSEPARLVKFFDVCHHLYSAATLPPAGWKMEKRLATLSKGMEIGEACISSHQDGRYPQLSHFINLLYPRVYEAVKADPEGKGREFDSDLHEIVVQARRHKKPLSRPKALPHCVVADVNHPVYNPEEKILKGVCRLYLDRDGKVVSYSVYVNPYRDYTNPANSVAEDLRDTLEREKNGELVRTASQQVVDDDKVRALEKESVGQRELDAAPIRISRRPPPSCREFHMQTPMELDTFLGIASRNGAITEKGISDVRQAVLLSNYHLFQHMEKMPVAAIAA